MRDKDCRSVLILHPPPSEYEELKGLLNKRFTTEDPENMESWKYKTDIITE